MDAQVVGEITLNKSDVGVWNYQSELLFALREEPITHLNDWLPP